MPSHLVEMRPFCANTREHTTHGGPFGIVVTLVTLAMAPFLFGAVHPIPCLLICAGVTIGGISFTAKDDKAAVALIMLWLGAGVLNVFFNPAWHSAWPLPTLLMTPALYAAFRAGSALPPPIFAVTTIAVGVACAGLALVQWPTDNGLLLWNFAPQTVFVSERARWPFVNPNHLAIFLLVPWCLAISRLIAATRAVTSWQRRARPLHDQLATTLPSLLLSLAPVALLTAAIAATLSRNGWSCAIAALAIGSLLERRVANWRMRLITVGGLIACIVLMLLTTSERARFAVEERVAFGVTASFSDPRWDLMSASVLLWLEHPWFGSGWGSWAARFELVKPTHLSHLLPEHAHNDLIELLVENGVLGTLPLVALAMITLQVRGFKTPRSPDGRWLIVGLSAVCLASLLDFPFHIPAISLWWACAAGSLRYTELDQKA